MGSSVLLPWVEVLPWRMQTVLLLALRGCDGRPKNDISKVLVRFLRSQVLKNADPSNSFHGAGWPTEAPALYLADLDAYPVHFVSHLMHAYEILGVFHPDETTAHYADQFYLDTCRALHVNPETPEQLRVRLGHTPAETGGSEAEHIWDAGTGTSHPLHREAT